MEGVVDLHITHAIASLRRSTIAIGRGFTRWSREGFSHYDGHINFGMWKVCMMVVLTQQNLKIALSGKEKKSAMMTDSEWDETDDKALSVIQLCITDDVL
ncbi:Retrovirus-related Pol polyprotein from transposon TNT 1-94 [Sesbania bispinosa]|nr:Retrovirus-related Pol polyprotein from transposon TNT 1-94 [Sesbania bispinosa]